MNNINLTSTPYGDITDYANNPELRIKLCDVEAFLKGTNKKYTPKNKFHFLVFYKGNLKGSVPSNEILSVDQIAEKFYQRYDV